MAFVKRMIQLGGKSGICTANSSRWLSSNSSGYKAVDVDIPSPATSLSIPSKAIPSVISEISNGSFKTTSQNPYLIDKLQKNLRRQEVNVLEFNSDFKKLQEDHCWMAQNHAKMLNNIKELQQLMNETSEEMAKIIAGQGSGLDPSEKKINVDKLPNPNPSEKKDCCRHCCSTVLDTNTARRASVPGLSDTALEEFMNLFIALSFGLVFTVVAFLAVKLVMQVCWT